MIKTIQLIAKRDIILKTYINRYFVFAIMLAVLPLYFLMLPTFQVGAWRDDGYYIVLAQSLAQGQGLRLIHLLGEPLTAIVPVGYPLLLSPLVVLFPDTYLPLQILSIVFTIGTIYLIYHYAKDKVGLFIAALVILLFAFNSHVASASIHVMAEAAFVFFIWLAIVALEYYEDQEKPTLLLTLTVAAITASMVLIRYLGIPLVIAAVVYIFFRRRDRYALFFAIMLLATIGFGSMASGFDIVWERYSQIGSWLLYTVGIERASVDAVTIMDSSRSIWETIPRNIHHLITLALPATIAPLFYGPRVEAFFVSIGLPFIPVLFQLVISGFIFIGFIHRLRHRISVVELFFVFYSLFLIVVVTGWPELVSRLRYFFPMTAFALLYFLSAFSLTGKWLSRLKIVPGSRHMSIAIPVSVACLILLLSLARNVQAVVDPVRNRLPDVSLGATWIAKNTHEDSIIMAQVPRTSYLYAKRKMVPFPNDSSFYQENIACNTNECIEEIIQTHNVTHILISYELVPGPPFAWSPYTRDIFVPYLEQNTDRFTELFSTPDQRVRVYEVQTLFSITPSATP